MVVCVDIEVTLPIEVMLLVDLRPEPLKLRRTNGLFKPAFNNH